MHYHRVLQRTNKKTFTNERSLCNKWNFLLCSFCLFNQEFPNKFIHKKKNVSEDVFCNKMCHYIKGMKGKCRSVDLNRNLYLINYDLEAKIVPDCNFPSENGFEFWLEPSTYRVLQRIQMKLVLLCVWAERAVLGTALKFKYEI